MFSIRAVGVVLAGGMLLGCHSGDVSGPNASTQIPTDQQTAAGLLRSWESTHPGSHAGVVNAVLPARRLASVTEMPVNEIGDGTVITILDDRQRTLVSGVVVARRGSDLHIRYEALAGGERDPRVGDLAVWFPGGQAVAPETMQPGATTQPAMAPADNMPATNAPPAVNPPPGNDAAPPATQPGTGTDTAAPATTQPASGTGATGAPASTANDASNTTGTAGTATQQPAQGEVNK